MATEPSHATSGNWGVYECDRIKRGETPQNERLIGLGYDRPGDAMDRANELKRTNPGRSYTVGWCG